MKTYCTYCSAKKDNSSRELPALKRYKSNRITSIYDLAIKSKIPFYILSGKYGILHPEDTIPYYDTLLKPTKIIDHSNTVAKQLKNLGISELIFYLKSIQEDPNIKPYIECLKLATEKAGVNFILMNFPISSGNDSLY